MCKEHHKRITRQRAEQDKRCAYNIYKNFEVQSVSVAHFNPTYKGSRCLKTETEGDGSLNVYRATISFRNYLFEFVLIFMLN